MAEKEQSLDELMASLHIEQIVVSKHATVIEYKPSGTTPKDRENAHSGKNPTTGKRSWGR